nr:Septum site-determining protein MinC [Raoultella sp. NCTC 9187]
MSNTPIELKGSSFTLSVVHLHDANPEVIRQALEDKIAQAPAFLRHAPVVVNISSIENVVDWRAMQEAIATTGLRIIGVSGCKVPRLKAEIDRTRDPFTDGRERKKASSGTARTGCRPASC